jgi:antitoxin Phd
MNINTNSIVSMTEANQNFSRVARLVDENGAAVILKNNTPRYLVIDFSQAEKEQTMPNEDILALSRRLIAQNREAYEVLAK